MSILDTTIGKSVPLRDGIDKITGAAKYSADIKLDGMLHVKILGSPYAHAKIKHIDFGRAKSIEGVVEILTHENQPREQFYPVNSRPMYVMDEQVRYVGEPVVVLAAETEEIADNALRLIKVEYDELPSVFDPLEAAQPNAPKLYPEGNIIGRNVGQPVIVQWGDVEKAISEADIVVEGIFRTPMQGLAPIEPRSCVASWNGSELTVWASTQLPHPVAIDLNTVLKIPLKQIKVISHFLGGGFGGKKQEEYPLMAAILSTRTNRPVRIEYSRQEETIVGRRRFSSTENIRIAALKTGEIKAIDFEAYYDVGAHGNFTGGSLNLQQSMLYLYKIENAIFKGYDVNTNLPTAQPWRGVQYPAYHFGVEQLIDQIAEKINKDSIEIRLNNTYRTGEVTKPYGAKLSNYAIEECVSKAVGVAEFRSKWRGWGKPVEMKNSIRKGIGVGLSMGWCDWMREFSSAIVKIFPNGTATIISGAQDLGTGCNTTLPQLVAAELKLPLEKVNLVTGDTSRTPVDWGALASRTLYICGIAAINAAKDARRKLFEIVSRRLEISKRRLSFINGAIVTDSKLIKLSDIINEPIVGSFQGKQTETVAPLRPAIYPGGAVFHIAEVEVDIDTGQVKISKYTAAQDVGKAINPLVVEGQIQGSVIQGIGHSLKEELLFDKYTGIPMNHDFLDYKICDFQDIPHIDTIIIESEDPTHPFGALGVGEHGINPVAGAIANAVYNAVGIRMYEIPMTPERILKAMGKI
ncbi:xanthine dehydrogenase family protein molybdopterin-binding subunit [Chloroflexota bacterium]